jgi:acyl carrier protein
VPVGAREESRHMHSRIAAVIARTFKIPADSVNAESGPHTIPAWDSAGHMNLVLELEKEFGVIFPDDDVVELIDLEAIVAALLRHR